MVETRGYWNRLSEKPACALRAGKQTSRRQLLRGTAVAGSGLTAAILTGCGAEKRPLDRPIVTQPKGGGVLTHGGSTAAAQGTGLDPMVNNSTFFARSFRMFYQGLIAYAFRTYDAEPELAQRWEQPSQTEYLFTLQSGVKWHNKPPVNGRELTVEDVLYSLERARQPNPQILTRGYLISADKIEAMDKSTIRITTKSPDASFLNKLSADSIVVLAPEVLEKTGGRIPDVDAAVGTGAFIITSAEQGVGARHVRNPDYWKPGLPYLDELRVLHFAEDETRWAAFLGGKVDGARVPGSEVKKYIAQQGPDYTPDWFADDQGRQTFPNTKKPPMNDPRVYRALRLLQDHEEMRTTIGELTYGRTRNGSIFVTALQHWDLTHEEYSNYLEWKQPKDEAVKVGLDLLRAAGFTRENPLRFEIEYPSDSSPEFAQVSQLLHAQWRRFTQGIVETEIKPYPRAVIAERGAREQFTYVYRGLSGGIADVDATLAQVYQTGSSFNYARFSDSKLDAMIERQRTLFDIHQRKAQIREIILYMMDNSPYTTPYLTYTLQGVKPHIRDKVPEASQLNGRQYERVWLDI